METLNINGRKYKVCYIEEGKDEPHARACNFKCDLNLMPKGEEDCNSELYLDLCKPYGERAYFKLIK